MGEETATGKDRQQAHDGGPWAGIRRHPVITATLILCTAVGAIAGFVYLDPEWSVLRRIAAGAVAGGGTGLLFTATKMIG